MVYRGRSSNALPPKAIASSSLPTIGIKSHAEARLARELGVDLIICDHHLPDGEDVPADAFAVLCPKGSSGTEYPNKHLAACGVALKLADALLEGHARREATLASLAKLTAIGSIADLVDLSASENRAIVAHGLRALSQRNRQSRTVRAARSLRRLAIPLTTYDVGFKIGPAHQRRRAHCALPTPCSRSSPLKPPKKRRGWR